ncbi:sialic acid-binding Ig-like lectin 13 [Phyllobates terribilis]|uniref:sialic acid-binding Ig-like lectin 13 n=1 Tax=Phyllobates terribilis TaxID=111132 RepID=UPI003CCAF340
MFSSARLKNATKGEGSCKTIHTSSQPKVHLSVKMWHIRHSSLWISRAIILLFWKGITCQVPRYSIQVPFRVNVQEGLCVTIPCTFTANSRNTFNNTSGYWIRRQEPFYPFYIVATNDKSSVVKKANFHLMGNPDTGDCTLTITDARKEDNGIYYFRFEASKDSAVKYSYDIDARTEISVTDLTEEPVIADLGTVVAGVTKTLTCAPPRDCHPTSLNFQWRKSGVADVWKKSSTLTFIPSLNDHQKNITCEMTNSKGRTTKKTILLDVYSLPRSMEITIHSSKGGDLPVDQPVLMDETETLTLVCRANDNPTPNVIWVKGEIDMETTRISDSGLSAIINVTSLMVDVYRCLAWNAFGFTERRIKVGTKPVCTQRTVDSAIIIGIVIGNIAILILIIVGSCYFLRKHVEKANKSLDSRTQVTEVTESTYQELKGQKTDIYYNMRAQK